MPPSSTEQRIGSVQLRVGQIVHGDLDLHERIRPRGDFERQICIVVLLPARPRRFAKQLVQVQSCEVEISRYHIWSAAGTFDQLQQRRIDGAAIQGAISTG